MEPFLYSVMDKNRLEELLDAFHATIRLPIQLLDEDGSVLLSRGKKSSYCRHFVSHLPEKEANCSAVHAAASRRAVAIGEAYIFSCHSNLNHIVFPLMNGDRQYGSVLVGPFLMTPPDSTLIMDIAHRYAGFSMEDLMELYDDAAELPVVEPPMVTQVSRLLYYLFSSFLIDARERFIINQKKVSQQARIGEAIQMFKQEEPDPRDRYPVELEQKLLTMVRVGNLEASRDLLNRILGYVFLSSGNSLETVKTRTIELCSLLSRAIMESGVVPDKVLRINNELLKKLPDYKTLEGICYAANELLQEFVETAFPAQAGESTANIREAMQFLSANYQKPLSLSDAAEHVHLNPAYFSRRFREVTGSTFREYLTGVRVEEAKRLLRGTDYTLADISLAAGFDSQSYFTKVFKERTGFTPRQYREME